MISFPAFLGFLAPLPARFRDDAKDHTLPKRRRAVDASRLSPHLLRDTGLDDMEILASDPRWRRRPELER